MDPLGPIRLLLGCVKPGSISKRESIVCSLYSLSRFCEKKLIKQHWRNTFRNIMKYLKFRIYPWILHVWHGQHGTMAPCLFASAWTVAGPRWSSQVSPRNPLNIGIGGPAALKPGWIGTMWGPQTWCERWLTKAPVTSSLFAYHKP